MSPRTPVAIPQKENLDSPEYFGSFSSFNGEPVGVPLVGIPVAPTTGEITPSQSSPTRTGEVFSPLPNSPPIPTEPTLKIEDAIDESTGLSVLAPTSHTGLQGDIQGRILKLTLKGLFISPHPFQVFQSNGIEWTITHSSPTTLTLERDTLHVVDFYLVGTHKFKITSPNLQQSFHVKIDRPLQRDCLYGHKILCPYLYPVIQEVKQNSPQSLIITTKNACLNPRFQQVKLNNEIIPIGSVSLSSTGISTLEVPLSNSALVIDEFTVQLTTPFGSTFWKGIVAP
jgi:hypothetical protein